MRRRAELAKEGSPKAVPPCPGRTPRWPRPRSVAKLAELAETMFANVPTTGASLIAREFARFAPDEPLAFVEECYADALSGCARSPTM